MLLSQHDRDYNDELNTVVQLQKKRRPKRKRIKIKYRALLCAVIVLCLSVNLIQLNWQIVKLDKEIDMQKQQKQQLLTYQAQLKEDMKMVQKGDYIEKLAREQLRMVKPGEKPVVTKNNSGDISN